VIALAEPALRPPRSPRLPIATINLRVEISTMSAEKFSRDHQWIRLDADGIATVGITDYAQQQLGDVVYVDLPMVGAVFDQHADVAVVESVKSAGEVKAPAGGEVVDVNTALLEEPQKVNADPTGEGWFFKLRLTNAEELASLLDESAYNEFVQGLS
jgi:glycine cleavage system H protein